MSAATSDSIYDETWIQWFCRRKGHEFFCEVDRSYIEDGFNLYGLKETPHYTRAMDVILDNPTADDSANTEISSAAFHLYGLIHSRYILTSNGLDSMRNKFMLKDFGECPRMFCEGQAVLPMGTSCEPAQDAVKLFCPKCQQVYTSHYTHAYIDGVYFGPTFPHLFLMTYEEFICPPSLRQYIPRMFGFRIHDPNSRVRRRPPDSSPRLSRSLSRNSNHSPTSQDQEMTEQKPKRQRVQLDGGGASAELEPNIYTHTHMQTQSNQKSVQSQHAGLTSTHSHMHTQTVSLETDGDGGAGPERSAQMLQSTSSYAV